MECIQSVILLSRVRGCNVFLGSAPPPTVRGRGSSVPINYVIAYMQAHSNNDQILGWSNEMWGTFLLRESTGNGDARSVCGSWPCFSNSVRLSVCPTILWLSEWAYIVTLSGRPGSGIILVFFAAAMPLQNSKVNHAAWALKPTRGVGKKPVIRIMSWRRTFNNKELLKLLKSIFEITKKS